MLAKLIFVLFILKHTTGSSDNRRIFQGTQVYIRNFPYAIRLVYKPAVDHRYERHLCTGVIISVYIALTAGHCLTRHKYPVMAIRTGTSFYDGDSEATYHRIRAAKVHPEYDATGHHDIGVILVRESFQFGPTRQSIELAQSTPQVGQKGWVLGWGFVDRIKRNPTLLRLAVQNVVNNEECVELFIGFNDFCTTHPSMILCEGDSGGPFIIKGVLYGIATNSYEAENCYEKKYPRARFTDIWKHRTWIEETSEFLKKRYGNGN